VEVYNKKTQNRYGYNSKIIFAPMSVEQLDTNLQTVRTVTMASSQTK